jgi:hypothetical protein
MADDKKKKADPAKAKGGGKPAEKAGQKQGKPAKAAPKAVQASEGPEDRLPSRLKAKYLEQVVPDAAEAVRVHQPDAGAAAGHEGDASTWASARPPGQREDHRDGR